MTKCTNVIRTLGYPTLDLPPVVENHVGNWEGYLRMLTAWQCLSHHFNTCQGTTSRDVDEGQSVTLF